MARRDAEPDPRDAAQARRGGPLSRRRLLRWGGRTLAGLALGAGTGALDHPEPLSAAPPAAPGATPPGERAEGAPARVPRRVALIANSESHTLTVVDAESFEPAGTLPAGREPHKFRLSLAGTSVYACNVTSNELIEIDLRTLHPLRRVPILDPYNVAFSPDRRRLYKVAYRYTFVEIHDARTFARIRRLETGRQPSHFFFSPDGRWYANANQRSHTVTVIDTARLEVVHRLPVDPLPAGVEFSHDGRYLFVASGGAGTIGVYDVETWRFVRRVASGTDAHEMIPTRDGRTIFVTNRGEHTVSAFDVPTQRVVEKFRSPGGPDMPVLSADGAHLWISGRYGDTTTVIDAKTLTILRTFRTGRSPHGVFLAATGA